MNCEVGDIVLVDRYVYPDGSEGSYHNFVIMDERDGKFDAVPLDYIGFLISSKAGKNNDVNINFPYNEPIYPDNYNKLRDIGHVKCDIPFSILPDNIIMKLGVVSIPQYERFLELYEQSKHNQ